MYTNRQSRFYSGIWSAALSGLICFTFLEPLFTTVDTEVAIFALYILTFSGAMVGMSLGLMMPVPMSGACLGVAITLLLGVFIPFSFSLYFPVVGPALALICVGLSLK